MRKLVLLVLLAGAAAGCDGMGRWPGKKQAPAQAAPVTAEQAGASATQQPVMAYVNGRAIPMSELNDLLVRSHGLQAAYQLIADELVRQAAADQNVTINGHETKAEENRTLEELFGQVEQADQRERLLEQLLTQRGISHRQWQMIMRRNAVLRKLAEPRVTVGDADLAEEFGRQYGRKVQVRHIQTESLTSAQEVLDRLKAGEDFAEVARQMSVNPSSADGGLLLPIGPDSVMVPPALREAALALRQVGQVSSPVQVETAFHILRLEEVIEPNSVDFSQVRDKLTEAVHNRRLRAEQQKLLQELIKTAQDARTIRYVDPVLKEQVQAAEEQARQP